MAEDTLDTIQDLDALTRVLCLPLHSAGILPLKFKKYYSPPPDSTRNALKQFPAIQRTLLEKILPTWDHILAEKSLSGIAEQYFCPESSSEVACQVATMAYSTIVALPLNQYSIRFLSRLAQEYPIDRLHQAVSSSVAWEDCVRNIIIVPAKVANFCGGKEPIPDELEHATYFNNICLRTEHMIWSEAMSTDEVQNVAYLLTKLVHVGVFPPRPPTIRSQPAFFATCLPIIRERSGDAYYLHWSTIIAALPSSTIIQSIFTSLFSSLDPVEPINGSPRARGIVKTEAELLQNIFGSLTVENRELWDSVSAVVLGREWDEGKARVLVCWVGDNESGLELLLSKALDVWASPDHIKHSLLSRHHYLTCLLLVTLSYLPPSSSQASSLALSPSFIGSIGIYIKHLDPNVRRCGMFVAEEVARRAGKKLDFGGWDGDDAGRAWVKSMRILITARDIDFELVEQKSEDAHVEVPALSTASPHRPLATEVLEADSDDESVEGYASSGGSDRSTSPTPSDLDEIEKDPTLNVGIKKVPRPVYLAQLGELVRSTTAGLKSGENMEPQKIEMALGCGEELIRRKRSFGTELEENAVNLVYAFVGLQDAYDLDGFDVKRQAIVTALIVCCPRKASPAIIEEFFKNQYSTDQRYVMLTALALGARELASLPVPPSTVSQERTSFPTKKLPPGLHQKLLPGNPVQRLLVDISQHAIDKSKEHTAERIPEVVRERQLRLQKPAKISSTSTPAATPQQAKHTFTELAAEYFICPFINRFWLFLRDEQTREARSSLNADPMYRYRGAGTGLVLNPVVLCQFLSTLGVLVHAARNAVQWLALIAPDALELAVTLGTRPVSRVEDEGDAEDDEELESGGGRGKEALVLCTALELAVVVLDGCLEVDGGKSLGLEHTSLVFGAGEWAGKLLGHLEKGALVAGGGGALEVRLRRAAAGVVLKVDEVTSKWRRSMVDVF